MRNLWLKIEFLIGNIYDWFFKWLPFIWHFEFFNIDSKHPITFGRVIIGVIAFLIGYQIAKRLVIQMEKRILIRLDIEPAFRYSIKTLTFYILILFLFFFVLHLLNIPLTALTITGGALALGVSLGAQSIIYDLLSGLVIMLEHPIRTGDLVELDHVRGQVESIGARATKVYTVDNKHLIIPNNFFLSKIILNWTLSNEIIRSDVQVGVSYGSPVDKVQKLLAQAADEHPLIKKQPEPLVLLSDFGNNAILFDLYFWAQIDSVITMKKIQSDLRFHLTQLFAADGIVIAFPQRDLHLKSNSTPLKVEVLPSQKPSSKD